MELLVNHTITLLLITLPDGRKRNSEEIYIIGDFLSQILLHQEDFADLLARTLYDPEHQWVIAALQLHSLCSGHQSIATDTRAGVENNVCRGRTTRQRVTLTHLHLRAQGRWQSHPGCFQFWTCWGEPAAPEALSCSCWCERWSLSRRQAWTLLSEGEHNTHLFMTFFSRRLLLHLTPLI